MKKKKIKRFWAVTLASVVVIVFLVPLTLSFLKQSYRSNWALDQSSLRSLATGLESYYVDWGTYPENLLQLTQQAEISAKPVGRTILVGPYIDSIPLSSFDQKTIPRYAVLKSSETQYSVIWIAAFPFTDGDWDLPPESRLSSGFEAFLNNGRWPDEMVNAHYDPSNGSQSSGDIIRMKQ